MQYYKSAMFIPGKGQAFTYSEATDDDTVLRTLTHIPSPPRSAASLIRW
jgi:hypothetical protein